MRMRRAEIGDLNAVMAIVRGFADALMKQAEKVALDSEIQILRVDTNTVNQATQKLFPKLGYVLAGEIELGFRPGLKFLCYEKRI